MSHIASSSLRAVTFRIASTPVKQLPHLISWIVSTLQSSKTLFASTGAGKAKDSADGVLVHKFKTQITTLLNDKTSEGRWAAIVLIKTTIDLGGWEVLQASGAWVRGLLGLLGRQDSLAVKKLCIITLTRIFLCTHEYPTLIREITTPSLPAFLAACLNLVDPKSTTGKTSQTKPKDELIPMVLESFGQLLPNHPTIFRSFETRLTDFLLPLMAPAEALDKAHPLSASHHFLNSSTTAAAQRLYVLLHYCAPKSSSSEDWLKRISSTLSQCHVTADIVFRAVIEDYEPVARSMPRETTTTNFSTLAKEEASAPLALPAWYGLRAGSSRLVGVMNLLKSFIIAQTATPVSFPIAEVVDLVLRVLSVAGPTSHGAQNQSNMTFNKEISRDEREELWIELPSIHEAGIELLGALLDRFEGASTAVVPAALDQIAWIFRREAHSASVRHAAYETVAKALLLSGAGFTRPQVLDLSRVVLSACEDILPEEQKTSEETKTPSAPAKGTQKKTSSLNADTFLNAQASIQNNQDRSHEPLYQAAMGFMTAVLARVPSQHIGQSLRARIDRTAVLSGNAQMMLASVLNPPYSTWQAKTRSSILPLLARAAPNDLATEGLLRPRLPAIKVNHVGARDHEGGEANGEDEEQESENGFQAENTERHDSEEEAPIDINDSTIANSPDSNTPATTTEHLPPSNANELKAITDSLKRNASNAHPLSPDPKRTHTRAQDQQEPSTDADPASKQLLRETAMPVPVVIEGSSENAEGTTTATIAANEVVVPVVENEDDGSDVEIPEIDIEPDTEEEDEDELA